MVAFQTLTAAPCSPPLPGRIAAKITHKTRDSRSNIWASWWYRSTVS